jgi:hypothetical protein
MYNVPQIFSSVYVNSAEGKRIIMENTIKMLAKSATIRHTFELILQSTS